MTKLENLRLAWDAFMRADGDEATVAWRRATDLASKKDLINLASSLAGTVSALHEVQRLSVAQKPGRNVMAKLVQNAKGRKEVVPC